MGKSPSTDPQLRNITPPKGMYPENTVNEPTTMTPIGRPPMPAGPYPGHAPPSPSATPPHHYAYPHPAFAHSPYAQPHLPQFPHQAPPTPQSGLPHPQGSTNGHTPPTGWPPARSPGIPGYPGAGGATHQSPYASTQAPSSAPSLAAVANSYQHKPPSPPDTSAATTKPFSEPPPLKDVPATNGGASKIIPSITALINGPPEARENATGQRSGSKSPGRVVRDVPNAITATASQRDKGDLKKLDSQLLKGKS